MTITNNERSESYDFIPDNSTYNNPAMRPFHVDRHGVSSWLPAVARTSPPIMLTSNTSSTGAGSSSIQQQPFQAQLDNIIRKNNEGYDVATDCWHLISMAQSKPNFYELIKSAISKFSNNDTLLKKLLIPDNIEIMGSLSFHQRTNIVSSVMACSPNRNLQFSSVSQQRNDRNFSEYNNYLRLNDSGFYGKKILLVGGGNSDLRASLTGAKNITNIDLHKPSSRRAADKHIRGDFCDYGNIIRGSGNNGKDEVWCLFSLPMYARSVEETKNFFNNAISSLSDNGRLRIFPIFEKSPLGSQSHPAYSLVTKDLEGLERSIMQTIGNRPDLFEVSYHEAEYRHGGTFGPRVSQSTGVNINIKSGMHSQAVDHLRDSLRTL